uniref:Transcription elongation factor Eaf N-terminal domain-containing protein n=1 Tax=Vombatus ursinus TaxID=29139 RepID=A0A4X2LLQ9_VOMUR
MEARASVENLGRAGRSGRYLQAASPAGRRAKARTANPLLDGREHCLKLGDSFQERPKSFFHTIRYDFKPAAIDASAQGELQVAKGDEVTLVLPHIPGAAHARSVFQGNKRPYQRDCVLIINHDTGECVLEKLTSSIQVKKRRTEGSSHTEARREQPPAGAPPPPVARRAPGKASAGPKTSPVKENPLPQLQLDDLKRELRADSSSSESSWSDSESSSSSDDDSAGASMDVDEPAARAFPSQPPQPHLSGGNPGTNGPSRPPGNNQLLDILRSDLQVSESGSDSEDS